MKIDSPTFLSETTFISSSVVFSSGSQKFGNTSDDTHQFTGSISVSGNVNGSSTSTGSFGRVGITGTAGAIVIPNGTQGLIIGDQPYHGYLKYSSTGNQILAARSNGVHGATIIQNDGNKGRLGINTNDAVNSFQGSGDQDIVLMVEGNISSSGNFITTGNVSGSSTSTGSFGSLAVSDKVQGNINFGGTTNIFRTTTADQYTTVRIDQGTAQYGGKLHFGGALAGNADYIIGEIGGIWDYDTNVSPVSLIRFETGADTTNRDDGRITFWTSAASRNPVERLRIDPNGAIKITSDQTGTYGLYAYNNAVHVGTGASSLVAI